MRKVLAIWRLHFCDRITPQLIGFLEKNHIRYRKSCEDTHIPLVIFNVWSTDNDVDMYMSELQGMNVGKPIKIVEYSKRELEDAQLLWLFPKKQCIDIVNTHEVYRYSCRYTNGLGVEKAAHRIQKSPFKICREPSMNTKTAFWTISIGFGELFTDSRVLNLVKEANLSGIQFQNVFLKNGKPSEKLFQAVSVNVLGDDLIGKGYGERKIVCPVCGKEQYVINNAYQLHLDFTKILKESDFYMTERLFGEGQAYPLYLISQKFYKLLKDNNLLGGLTISPVAKI